MVICARYCSISTCYTPAPITSSTWSARATEPLDASLHPRPIRSLPLPMAASILTYTDRLYLASYITPPTAETLFPYPEPLMKSPSKRSQRAIEGPAPVTSTKTRKQPYYFTVDDTLLYNAFHHDFGPLHIGHLYRFALQFHEILGAKENKDRPVVFWSMADPRSM